MKKILIGIDGGGTKTRSIVSDIHGNILASGIGGPANIRISVEQAWNSIYQSINDAFSKCGLSLISSECEYNIGLGLAGISVQSAKENFLQTKHPFANLLLESDAYIACLGSNGGGNSSIISVGTGVAAYYINDFKHKKIGGWGFPHSDTGGGAWFGMEAVRATFKAIDGIIKFSYLTKEIFVKFKFSPYELSSWANNAKSTDFATLCDLVFEAYLQGDIQAKKLINIAVKEILKISLVLKQDSGNEKSFLIGGLSEKLIDFLPKDSNISLSDKSNSPEKGALLLIKNSFTNIND